MNVDANASINANVDANLFKLNPYHSCFILDGNIEFRTNLEQYLRKEFQIPMILIVLEGGEEKIKTVADALSQSTPILLIVV